MKKWLKNGRGHIAAACYLAALLCWLTLGTIRLAGDGIASLRGLQPETVLAAADFALVDLTPVDGVLSCASADPQMHWANAAGIRVRTVTLRARYDKLPQEICLYYKLGEQTDFTRAQRVFPKENADGSYSFFLPRTDVTALRLDVCSAYCVISDFSLTLNTSVPFWRYYLPGWWGAFQLLLYPGLAASAASLVHQAWLLRRKRGGAPADNG